METIKVQITWSEKNYAGGWGHPEVGTILVTSKSISDLKDQFISALQFHIEGMAEDGDEVPAWLLNGEYEVVYDLDAAALIREAQEYTSMAAISRATGINIKQLSHYANNVKKPRAAQRRRIVEGLHAIGQRLIAVI